MKTTFFLAFLCLLANSFLQAQGRLVLNGASLTISNGAFLVVDNPAPEAISRNSGYIYSEGENNRIKWNMGTTAATYTVPFGYNGSFIPVSFSKSGGSGSGSFVFSTYHTGWKNSDYLPAGIAGMGGQMSDQSQFAIDRFWQVSAEGYSVKPALTNLIFSYADAEHQAAGNSIMEMNLRAQQYNTVRDGWDPVQAGGTINTTTNSVTVATVPSDGQFKWWTLMDQLNPLSASPLAFTAVASGNSVVAAWKVNGETPGVKYILQRSKTGLAYENVATLNGTGGAGENRYAYRDTAAYSGQSFYRVRMEERNQPPYYSSVQTVWLKQQVSFVVYPNPVLTKELTVQLPRSLQTAGSIQVIHSSGKAVATYAIAAGQEKVLLRLPSTLPAGIYWCRLQAASGVVSQQSITVY